LLLWERSFADNADTACRELGIRRPDCARPDAFGPTHAALRWSRLLFSSSRRESAQNPAFSPDGSTVLLTVFHGGYNKGPAGLYVLPIQGGPARKLLDGPGVDSGRAAAPVKCFH
jgi:hypothetical protein